MHHLTLDGGCGGLGSGGAECGRRVAADVRAWRRGFCTLIGESEGGSYEMGRASRLCKVCLKNRQVTKLRNLEV